MADEYPSFDDYEREAEEQLCGQPTMTTSHRKAATMSDDRVELKPCPFCGKDAGCINEENDGYWRVICPCTAFGPLRATEDEAIAAWNQRLDPSIESLEADVGQLREALEEIATELVSEETMRSCAINTLASIKQPGGR